MTLIKIKRSFWDRVRAWVKREPPSYDVDLSELARVPRAMPRAMANGDVLVPLRGYTVPMSVKTYQRLVRGSDVWN